MSYGEVVGTVAAVLGGLGLGAGARARVKASSLVATAEVWKGEAEAQKARADRFESAVHELTEQIGSLRAEVRRLTSALRNVAPELIYEGGLHDDD